MTTFIAAVTGSDRAKNSDYNMTLEEIGQQLGVCRERVRQIEAKALAKLRRRCMPQLLHMREMANELRRNAGDCHGVIR